MSLHCRLMWKNTLSDYKDRLQAVAHVIVLFETKTPNTTRSLGFTDKLMQPDTADPMM